MPSRLPRLLRKLWRSFQALLQAISQSFFRFLFLPIKNKIQTKAGFVLPTATLVLLVVSLLVGTLVIRTGQEAEEAISEQAQQEIFNAATPAVDRAKAKIDFLISESSGNRIPPESELNSNLLDDGDYTLNDETRLDIHGDGNDDNAWEYQTDADGDGEEETTVRYSITMLTEDESSGTNIYSENKQKANNLVVRSGPLNSQPGGDGGCKNLSENLDRFNVADGWYPITGATFRKNFQINAVVENNNDVNKAVSTLEVQQNRELDAGNTWGAWFRYDLEFTPGSNFDWNGAMHTEGSLLVNNNASNTTRFRLISSPASCLYTRGKSRITMANQENPKFEGQLMRVDTNDDEFESGKVDNVVIDIFPDDPSKAPTDDNKDVEFPDSKDSVAPSGKSPSLFMLDPVELATAGNSQARNPNDPYNTDVRDNDWWSSEDNKIRERIYNDNARQPFVDDTYRADNRWGPKPKYNNKDDFALDATNDRGNGDPITDNKLTNTPNDENALTTDPGLDGYWERRAFMEGMRIIVGQRLELGNPQGWGGSSDRLYNLTPQNIELFSGQNNDYNPAAVQSAAVYHWDVNRDQPVACLAMTGHPGIPDSTDFDTINIGGTDFLETNFFEGIGTNGWEFPFPADFPDSGNFNLNDDGSELYRALENLAQFAGDPDGAFPPVQDDGSDSDAVTHPYSELAMWGNFSNLRRIINDLNAGTSYDDLSLADQTTLQTATCSLGMLAYNVEFKQKELEEEREVETEEDLGEALNDLSVGDWTSVGTQLVSSIGGNNVNQGNPIIGEGGAVCNSTGNGGQGFDEDGCPNYDPHQIDDINDPRSFTNYFSQFSLQDWLNFVEDGGIDAGAADDIRDVLEAYVNNLEQGTITELASVQRDRELGFREGVGTALGEETANFDPETGIYTVPSNLGSGINEGTQYRMGCDPNEDNFGFNFLGSDRARFAYGLIVCNSLSSEIEPRYPSLYYLFPTADHDHDGDGNQPPGETYITDPYITENSVNGNVTYQQITTAEIRNLALTPPTDSSNFVLPTDNNGSNQITLPDGTNLFVPFLDQAISDGREEMDVRVLDIDLDLLRSNTTPSGDFWLPTGADERDAGIVYAFREDALREDAIQRPSNDTWSNCNTESLLTGIDIAGGKGKALTGSASDSCRMLPGTPQDPPLNADTEISPKAIDSYEDPDRRPYGFRLRNGSDLSRNNIDGTGLSFITDQPIYIQGDFNVHTRDEFIDSNSDFYERSNLDPQFATPGGETWRPTEIIADSITLLSAGFDGDIANPSNNPPGPSGNIEVNSILVSALIPSLPRKYNGGIHNFPRFLENWGGEVTIRGSLIQLNFSQYATGAYDKENQDPTSPEDLDQGVDYGYYSAPNRNWGYDVGLQLNAAGPVAERFLTSNNAGTGTYRELSVDDPYIQNLLKADKSND